MRARSRFLSGRLTCPLLAAVVIAVAIPGPSAGALDYIDSSPSGYPFPTWDGGDTELCFADINNDGHVDFLSIGDHGSPYINTDQHGIMVYFGDGTGGWSIHMEGNFGYGGIAVGDVNNDGLLDVGYGMHHDYSSDDFGNQLLEVALGDGTGTSWTPWDDGLATNGEDWGMFATDFADFDHDGDLDVASNSFGCCNGVHVYRNNGDGTWTQTWARVGGNSRAHLCTGDVNGDGHPDIAASYQYGTIFLGDGEGGFTQADTGLPSGQVGLGGPSLGDVDGDGCADLSFSWNGGVRFYFWRDGGWELADAGLPISGPYEMTQLRDMNIDGELDIAAQGEGTFTVFLGDGAGNWAAGGGFYNGPAVETAAMEAGGDIDHNGYPDVAFVQEEGSWPSYRNYLYVYRESSAASERRVVVQFPRGAETILLGSVQTIRWCAAQLGTEPASIDLDLSVAGPGGPWVPIAGDLPDGGHHQWTASGAPSTQAHIRVTLTQDGESVSAVSRSFRLVPVDPSGVDEGRGAEIPQAVALGVRPSVVCGPVTFQISRPVLAGDRPPTQAGGWEPDWVLSVQDLTGRRFHRCVLPPGVTQVDWQPRDSHGRRLPAGVYIATLSRPAGMPPRVTERFLLLR